MSFFQPRQGGPVDADAEGRKAPPRMVPWVEKYRPKSMEDISHQDEAVESLRGAVKTGTLPHLLFYGPPGTGKTSTILALARELFGQELFADRVLELNASDERGISVVREKVKRFASTTVSRADTVNGNPAPPFKLIILDEADSMTMDAQSALRRTMELYTRVTRFCLICNYVSRIIEPLASRCAKFRFQPLADAPVRERLERICDVERVQCEDGAIDQVLLMSQGDMRKAITALQSSSQYNEGVVTKAGIIDLWGQPTDELVDALWGAMSSGSLDTLETTLQDVVASGYSASAVFEKLHAGIMSRPEFNDMQRAKMSVRLAAADKALEQGGNDEIQMRHVLVHFSSMVLRS